MGLVAMKWENDQIVLLKPRFHLKLLWNISHKILFTNAVSLHRKHLYWNDFYYGNYPSGSAASIFVSNFLSFYNRFYGNRNEVFHGGIKQEPWLEMIWRY